MPAVKIGKLSRFHRVGIPAQRVGDARDRLPGLPAVTRRVERGSDDGDAELAGGHGENAAAHAAFGREAGGIEPLALQGSRIIQMVSKGLFPN
jgi:hypothetical protein